MHVGGGSWGVFSRWVWRHMLREKRLLATLLFPSRGLSHCVSMCCTQHMCHTVLATRVVVGTITLQISPNQSTTRGPARGNCSLFCNACVRFSEIEFFLLRVGPLRISISVFKKPSPLALRRIPVSFTVPAQSRFTPSSESPTELMPITGHPHTFFLPTSSPCYSGIYRTRYSAPLLSPTPLQKPLPPPIRIPHH